MKLLIVSICAVLTGCVSSGNQLVPKTKIRADFKNGTADVEMPKDLTAEAIEFDKSGTDISVRIRNIKVRTNPEVIGAAGQAQTDALQVQGDNMLKAFEKGLNAVP